MSPTRARPAADFVPDVLAREGGLWVRAASSSMAPLVREGDSAPVAHRVLRRSPQGVVTKGDALPRADALVEWARVVARVAAPSSRRSRVAPASSRAAWIALRAPFHLLALLGR